MSDAGVEVVRSLDDLDRLCRETRRVTVRVNGRELAVEVRALTPSEDARVAMVCERVRPPLKEGRVPGQFYPDVNDPGFIEARAKAMLQSRALALRLGCPMFASIPLPEGADLTALTEAIQSKVSSAVLGALHEAVLEGTSGTLEEAVNFTSTPD